MELKCNYLVAMAPGMTNAFLYKLAGPARMAGGRPFLLGYWEPAYQYSRRRCAVDCHLYIDKIKTIHKPRILSNYEIYKTKIEH